MTTAQNRGDRWFSYPSHWELSEERDRDQVSMTVSSPGTSFWSLSLFFGQPRPKDLIETALETFREEYDDLDVYPGRKRLGRYKCIGRDLQFVCLELINSASLRALRMDGLTAFVLYQGTDQDLEETGPILEAISSSLRFEESDESHSGASDAD